MSWETKLVGRARKTGLTLTPLAGERKQHSIPSQLVVVCFTIHILIWLPLSQGQPRWGLRAPSEKVLNWPRQREIMHSPTKAFPGKKCQINPPELSLLPQSTAVDADLFLMPSLSRAELHLFRNISLSLTVLSFSLFSPSLHLGSLD